MYSCLFCLFLAAITISYSFGQNNLYKRIKFAMNAASSVNKSGEGAKVVEVSVPFLLPLPPLVSLFSFYLTSASSWSGVQILLVM